TGAGKSKLTRLPLRVLGELKGKIELYGVEIKYIVLHTLRSLVSIAPQYPQCFEGILQVNLDSMGSREDWPVL
ncbi:hypothetical protein PPACK8108_LOCUS21895, partial [Phakopsora pachyrhizi]